MKILKLLLIILVLPACGERNNKGPSCSVTATQIICPDGSSVNLPEDGLPGVDGRDGVDGVDGTNGSVIEILDPCGDYIHGNSPNNPNSADEVVLRLDNGLFLAWYKDLGFVVLDQGVIYQTTDKQKCSFMIQNDQLVNL